MSQVRRRWLAISALRDGGVFIGAAALLWLAILLAGDGVRWPRNGLAALIVSAGVAVVALLAHLWLSARRVRGDTSVAALIGTHYPELRSDLLSTLELAAAKRDRRGDFSVPLYRALANQTAGSLALVDARQVVSSAALRRTTLLLLGALLSWVLAAGLVPERLESGLGVLLAGDAEQIPVAEHALVGEIALVYQFPSYLRRPSMRVDASTGHVRAPIGTRVRLSTRPIVAVQRAWLVYRSAAAAQRYPLRDTGDQMVVQFRLDAEGSYAFEFETATRRILDRTERRVEIEPDASPHVMLRPPAERLEVRADQRIELEFVAEDDFGLSEVALVHQSGGASPVRWGLWPQKVTRDRRAEGVFLWDLSELRLEPGVPVTYWLDAVDNDTESGPKHGQSNVAELRLSSPDAQHRNTLALQQRAGDSALRLLAGRLLVADQPARGAGKLDKADRGRQRQGLARQQRELTDLLRRLSRAMARDPLVPSATRFTIKRMSKRHRSAALSEERVLAAGGRWSAQNRRQIAALEEDALLLFDLLDEQQLHSMVGLEQKLRAARKRIAQLLERYKKSPTEATKRKLQRELDRMKRDMEQLLQRMSALSGTIPDEYINADALKSADLPARLRRLAAAVRGSDVDQMARAVRELEQGLTQLQQLLQRNLSGYRSVRLDERTAAYAKLRDRLHALESEQRGLAKQTQGVAERHRQQVQRRQRGQLAAEAQRQLKTVQRLQRQVAEISSMPLRTHQRRQLGASRRHADALSNVLRQGDVDQALEVAGRVENRLGMLSDDVSEDVSDGFDSSHNRQLLQRLRAARATATELREQLSAIIPSSRSLLPTADRKRMQQLRRQQQRLARETRRLARELGQRQSPIGGELAPGIEDAAKLMERGASQLRAHAPQLAQSQQQAAAEGLRQLHQRLQKSRQPRQAGGAGERETVRIPKARDYVPPKEFREDILEAMREKAPMEYRRQVRRYYEDLVR